jgi:DNA-binding transcriptional regulator YbjK
MQFKWEGAFENWARAWIWGRPGQTGQFWRVEHVFGSEEDALQQCAMVFAKCLAYYGKTVTEPKHMMALFKRAVINHWTHNAKENTKQLAAEAPEPIDQRRNGAELLTTFSPDDRALIDIWESASPALRKALTLLSSASPRFFALLVDERISSDILNRRWQRFAGTHADHNIVDELRELLDARGKNASAESDLAVVRRS